MVSDPQKETQKRDKTNPQLDWFVVDGNIRLAGHFFVRAHNALRTVVHLNGGKDANLASSIALYLAVNHERLFV